ncbi:MAG: Crp/Fnr family transcriptional regulator [Cytophagales bacterium]|jgi:CRP-like cAMP-binding protein|nr:Crp/Fnr family transcriptional regulator [Cytophagales bacterium]
MYEAFKAYVEQWVSPSDDDYTHLFGVVQHQTFRKNAVIHQAGTVCSHIYFVTQGIARHYHTGEDMEGTTWFSSAGDVMTEFLSFISRQESHFSIVACTDVETLCITYDDLQQLYAACPVWNTFGRLTTEQYLARLIERNLNIHFKDARKKYEDFLQAHPDILNTVPLSQVASYLGIAQETLSRIRRNA